MRNSRILCLAVFVPGLALVSATATAHHALTAYDDESIVQIEGVVSRVHWRNPHIRILSSSSTRATAPWSVKSPKSVNRHELLLSIVQS